ncbi:GNAT family N-acetyltransferase [Secundilactobacillus odoratitofui]|nr:N-acetyltransferase [Secundilactobacillus odoratitofui]
MKLQSVTTPYSAASLDLITTAFATAEHSDGHEAELVATLRQQPNYHPEFDVIAIDDQSRLVGHALLSEAVVGEQWPVLVLAPLAVLPKAQRQGIGRALIAELEKRAAETKFLAISILGDPAYYGQFGYQPAADFGVTAPMAVESKYFMLKPLGQKRLQSVRGKLQYDPAFGI